MTRKKLFKIVFIEKTNQYEVWFTDHTGEMQFSKGYCTFTKKGEMVDWPCNDVAFISENILWDINKLTDLGYKFVGIERRK